LRSPQNKKSGFGPPSHAGISLQSKEAARLLIDERIAEHDRKKMEKDELSHYFPLRTGWISSLALSARMRAAISALSQGRSI
jgi:hypothetical protein